MGLKTGIKMPFSWRVGLAFLLALTCLQPAVIYLYLTTGSGLTMSTWMIIILWSEIARMFGQTLTPQEIFLIQAFEYSAVGNAWIFIDIIKNICFATSPITEAFGLSQFIPHWWAPTKEFVGQVLAHRSLLAQPLIVPILVLILTAILDLTASISLGYFSYHLYAVVEKLPFPFQTATAESIITVAEREAGKTRALMLSALAGALYGGLSNMLPSLTGSAVFQILPRGWKDYSYLSEQILPASCIGIDATLTTFISGFIMPLPVLIVASITSLGAYFFGNHYLHRLGIWPEWNPGMQLVTSIQRSQLYFWVSFGLGLAISAALIPLALRPKIVAGAFRSLGGSGGRKGIIWMLLGLFFTATISSVLLVKALVPDFPTWILILFSVGWSFFSTLIATNAMGVGASAYFNIPYLRESLIYFSGYKRADIWFANYITWGTAAPGAPVPPTFGLPLISTGASIAGSLKAAEIVGCKPVDFIKTLVIITLASWLASFVFANVFWSIAPIPSSAYPYTVTGWPVEIVDRNRWIRWLWTGILFKPDFILLGFIL
ncbi:MAG: hypothetical protein QW093_06035, partial [Candidatus Bathyarchaeia archaeon]